ncbi:iron chelate uptake ABC transporter family permease subunit [Vibrio sp. RC27]
MKTSTVLKILLFVSIIFVSLFICVGLTADNYEYFLSRRIPKVLAIILAGGAIAQSSLAFQTITNNRILTPSIMGFDALYLLIQVVVVVVFGAMSALVMNDYMNFAISVSIMIGFSLMLFSFYFRGSRLNLIALLLLGVIFGQLFSNIADFFIMLMDPNNFASVQSNMFASFNNVNVGLVYVCAPVLAVTSWGLYRLHAQLDVFWLDRDNAISLGVDVKKVTIQVLALSSVMIAISTALVGPILFFGILVTNLTREIFNTYQHRILLVGCALLAVTSLLSGQWVVENIFNFSTTLSVVINLIGGIYFLTILLRNKMV